MKIKTYEGNLVEMGHDISENERLIINKSHSNMDIYLNILTVEGKRELIDYLVECKDHGWFTITKKAFKRGSNCKKCANENRIKKMKKHCRKDNILTITQTCQECKNEFLIENLSRKREKKFCSKECLGKNRQRRLISQNKDINIRRKNSEKMKVDYANGKRTSSGGRSKWLVYKNLKVQGSFELSMCEALDALKNSEKILNWEYTNDRIPYNKVSGGKATYLLDFKVYLSKHFFFYIETKGFSVDNDIFKWNAVLKNGFSLKVFYQKTHECLIKENPEYILKFNYYNKLNTHIYKEKNDFKLLKPNKEFL